MANFFKASPKKSQAQQPVTVTVTRLDQQGCGVASMGKKPVFIDGVLPGEIAEVKVSQQNSKFAKAKLINLVKSSAERKEAKCGHYYQCGGCNLQHMEYTAQIDFKQNKVAQLFSRQSIDGNLPWQAAMTSDAWHYRRKARIGVQYNKRGEPIVGFRQRESNNLTEIKSCPVLVPEFSDIFLQLRGILPKLSGKNAIGHIEIIAANNNAVVVRQLSKMSKTDNQLWLQFADENQYSVYIDDGKQVAPLSGDSVLFYALTDTLDIKFSATSFIQVNHNVNQNMVKQALAWLSLEKDDVVLDLFCGLGNFSLPIAQCVQSVIGIEGVQDMVLRAGDNAKANGLSNCHFYQADLNSEWEDQSWALSTYTKALLDPARAGAYEALIQLIKFDIKKILYVSCDPMSLARDTKLLVEHGYKIEKIAIMDMFSQTKHVETMVMFSL
ncbi:23S rRNA (uracil(1939)-C(5))-methyltransferase RlmD [Cognaticolwellia mytili]|uniref:23S rRNA (uracil(1939)-C(5))-methyltransferase RlmD n=1 Tax=Cognaticolwellia mytili TaxID=1888913 RepID=UPI000A16F67F|nr:23S rRNA (uracil(1939)-C(5))-methyltransferase RlmD [Cognaticolwellia mytili]